MTEVKPRARQQAQHEPMACTIIPIHAAQAEPAAPPEPTRLVGDAAQVQRVLHALETDVSSQLPGIGPTARWLRELRLLQGEAFVLVAPDLGHDSLESAEIAFDTLRRLLPDTDIYVSAAPR
jgi:hypothetical protein